MKNIDEYQQLLLPEEVCEILRISLPSFYKRAWQGDIPIIKVGRSIRVDKRKLLKMLEENSNNV